MLVNSQESDNKHVQFISYSGEYPSLCLGELVLKIDNVEVKFGHSYSSPSWQQDGNYGRFWESGGAVLPGYASKDEWVINVQELPEQYRQYAAEIDRVFNSNVPHGCCGGCR